jgi:hypothetical protein
MIYFWALRCVEDSLHTKHQLVFWIKVADLEESAGEIPETNRLLFSTGLLPVIVIYIYITVCIDGFVHFRSTPHWDYRIGTGGHVLTHSTH